MKAVDVIPIEVSWLGPLPGTADLLAVKVDLLYEDEPNRVKWAKSELMRQGHTGTFKWAIAIKDARNRTYSCKVTEFRSTGQREQTWRQTEEQILVIVPAG